MKATAPTVIAIVTISTVVTITTTVMVLVCLLPSLFACLIIKNTVKFLSLFPTFPFPEGRMAESSILKLYEIIYSLSLSLS